jgi:outer membrane protein assembly factor BamB
MRPPENRVVGLRPIRYYNITMNYSVRPFPAVGASVVVVVFLSLAGFRLEAEDWPQWRGPDRSGHAATSAMSPRELPKDLQPKWRLSVGGGHSSPVLAGGRLIYLDQQNDREVAHALDARTGRELWRTEYSAGFQDEWGPGPRSTPIIDGDRVYIQSCSGEFRCLRLKDGAVVWKTSFNDDFGVKFNNKDGTASRRGNNGSGVIDGDRLVLPVGSPADASLVCFDKNTGQVLWKAGQDEAAYSSFMVASLAEVKQVVAFTADALLGADLADGRILWRVPLKTTAKRHAASPVIVGNRGMVNSHTLGLLCFEVRKSGTGFEAVSAWENKDLKINLATPVVVGDALYCQGANRDYICADVKTGKLLWSQAGFGTGRKDYASTIVAGDRLLVLTEDGQLLLLRPDRTKYSEVGRLQVCGTTWSHPAFADGRLYVRDGRQLFCVELQPGLASN